MSHDFPYQSVRESSVDEFYPKLPAIRMHDLLEEPWVSIPVRQGSFCLVVVFCKGLEKRGYRRCCLCCQSRFSCRVVTVQQHLGVFTEKVSALASHCLSEVENGSSNQFLIISNCKFCHLTSFIVDSISIRRNPLSAAHHLSIQKLVLSPFQMETCICWENLPWSLCIALKSFQTLLATSACNHLHLGRECFL